MFGFLRRKKQPPVPEGEGADAGRTQAPQPLPLETAPPAVPPEPAEPPASAESSARAAGRLDVQEPGAQAASVATTSREAAPVAQDAAAVPEPVREQEAPASPKPVPEQETAAAPEPAREQETAAASEPARAELAATAAASRQGWMARLRAGMSKTRTNLAGLFGGGKIDEALFEELETALLVSDAGVETTAWLLESLRTHVRQQRLADSSQVRTALRGLLVELLSPLEQPIDIDRATPLVLMIAGVNGAGKTTSIGKLAHHLQREGKSILLAAGDTFRAAAREQLAEWGARNDVQVIAQHGGDPAAVAFDAVSAGRARGVGVVMVDTAGRLPTQTHLMDELRKIHRVIGKAMSGAPHETLLVLDGNTGQNMLAQVRAFDDAVALTGLIVTKLDGTAKGGALAALAHTRRERPVPVYFVGVGEGIDDLQAFSAEEFASALLD